jgi:hypothetical protein
MKYKTATWFPLLLLTALPACGKDTAPPAPAAEGRFQFGVRALTLEDVSDVVYKLTVKNAQPAPNNVVWTKSVGSAQYGDGVGAITFVGACDGQSNPHTIEVVIEEMRAKDGELIPPSEYVNPAPASAPIVLERTCIAQEDVAVNLDLTIMRSANQGFFDIGVNFADIFCSAKLDCVASLLHDAELEGRGPTAVMAFACTAGQTRDGVPETTWLHFTDVMLTCDDQAPLYFDPSLPGGQHGALGAGPTFFQTAIYRGDEQVAGYDKCYWNLAFGLRAGPDKKNCRIQAQATASHMSFGDTGSSPADTIWGYVDWNVPLTDASGVITCGKEPLNGVGSKVATKYTPLTGAVFSHEWQCGTDAPVTRNLACAGAMDGGGEARFMPSPTGVSVDFAGTRSPTYKLPSGYFANNGAECCINPCCSAP